MDSLSVYEQEIERLESELNDNVSALAKRIRREVLLPFCRKHRLQFRVSVYESEFIREDGSVIQGYQLSSLIDDPMSEFVYDALYLRAGSIDLFDYQGFNDITEDYIKTT